MRVWIIYADYEVPRRYWTDYKEAQKALADYNNDRMMGGAMTKAILVELKKGD